MLNEMTFSQLSVLARSWGVQTDRNLSHERLYDACSEVVDGAINAPDADAKHRRIVTERFFGWRSQSQFRNQSRRRGAGIDSSDDGCDRPRARSASPGVDLAVEHFDCPICLEKVPSRSSLTLPCCGYEACKACVIQSTRVQISDRNSQLRCLHCSSITSYYTDFIDEIFLHLGPADVIAWRTRVALTSVPDCRQCTQCERIHVVDRALEGFPSVSCKGCGHVFCFDHGDAHAGQSCPPPSPQLIDAQMKISSISKQCPQCKVCIERSGGCPHMTCAVCGCEWCWTCSKPWYQANHVELLNTNADDSKNCITALLHFIICFFIGRDSVFSSANLCTCGGRNGSAARGVLWRRRGSLVTSRSLLHQLLLQAVLLRSALQPASQGRVLWTAYLCYLFSYFILQGASFVVTGIYHAILTGWPYFISAHYTNVQSHATYYTPFPLFFEALPGPPQLWQQFVHSIFAIAIVPLCGGAVGFLTIGVMTISNNVAHDILHCKARRLWRTFKRDPSSCLPVALPLSGALCCLPGIAAHDVYIFKFFFVWMASQLCLALFAEANSHCHWTTAGNDLDIWGLLWGIAAAVLKLVITMDSFDYCLIVCGCLALAYAFTAAILATSRYRNARSTLQLVTQQGILLLATSAALYAMLQ